MKKALFAPLAALLAAIAFTLAAPAARADSSGEFFRAIKSDNASAMQTLLARGMDPNTRDERGRPGLHVALQDESMHVAEALLASPRLDVNAQNQVGETALMLAALKGRLDLARRLIAMGAHVNKTGWTPLHYAATGGHVPVLELLIEQHAFIDAQSPNHTTPLMMAAGYGSPEAVQYLLRQGADTQMRNQQKMSALDFAKRYERPDAIRLLSRLPQPARPAAPRGQW